MRHAARRAPVRMSDEVVIRAEGLEEKSLITQASERERCVALRDVLARGARHAWRNGKIVVDRVVGEVGEVRDAADG